MPTMKSTLISLAALLSIVHASPTHLLTRADNNLICNKRGWDNGHESYQTWQYTTTYGDCAEMCSRAKCVSFAYHDKTSYEEEPGECQLYNVAAKDNFVADENSPYTFWDRECGNSRKQCGVTGWTRTDTLYYQKLNALSDCTAWCASYGELCASYAYGNGECFMFTAMVAEGADLDPSSPYKFYDHACIGASSSTTTTKTTTTTIKTTTKAPTSTTGKTTSSATVTGKTSSTASSKSTSSIKPTTTTSSAITKSTTSVIKTTSATASSTGTPSSQICGRNGYMSGSSAFHGYSTPYDKPTQEALSQCYNYCLTTTESYCTAWVWSPNTCLLYSYGVDGHFQSTSDNTSYVWDRNCGAPVATVTTTKTTTTTKATSVTTSSTKVSTTTTKLASTSALTTSKATTSTR